MATFKVSRKKKDLEMYLKRQQRSERGDAHLAHAAIPQP